MLFANVVGDVVWIAFCLVVIGLCCAVYHIGSLVFYWCSSKHSRRAMRYKAKSDELKFAEEELDALHRAADLKQEEVNRLREELVQI